MLKLRTVLHKKINKQGFTLAELLVVVAIIAILVAVSIPIFSGKLTEARRSVDLANVRAAKAAGITAYLSEGISGTWFYDAENGVMVKDRIQQGYNQFANNSYNQKAKAAIVEVKITKANPKDKIEVKWVLSKEYQK